MTAGYLLWIPLEVQLGPLWGLFRSQPRKLQLGPQTPCGIPEVLRDFGVHTEPCDLSPR